MQLIKVPDDHEIGFTHNLHSPNHLVEMGVHRVMYGHRVRAGFCANRGCVELDWCGGDRWEDVERLYSLLFAILSQRPEDRHCFDGLPMCSSIKPFYRDLDFVQAVSKAAGEFELLKLERSR